MTAKVTGLAGADPAHRGTAAGPHGRRDGELVPPEEQDRTRWQTDLIRDGTALIDGVRHRSTNITTWTRTH
jgi:predicted RNA polymerase sigma factor